MHKSSLRLLSSLIFAFLLFIILGWSDVSAFSTNAETQGLILYVKPGANGTCTSWEDACELQTALFNAVDGDQIWVAAGTYKPTTTTNREATFQLKSGVAIYGGFPAVGGEWFQRNWLTNLTTLSGDIGAVGTIGDNSYHVVTGSGTDDESILDGFTITAGYSYGSVPDVGGAGLYNENGNPTLNNVTFTENTAAEGGGMYNSNGSPILSNVIFSGNSAAYGAGMFNEFGNPTLNSVSFIGNSGAYGGGMHNISSNPILTNVTFSDNIVSGTYGYGGGMYNDTSNPMLSNVTLTNNTASGSYGYGGGIYNETSSPTLISVTLSGNSANNGGGMYNKSSSPMLTNVTFSGNTGRGMVNDSSSPTLTDVTFSENAGGGMSNGTGSNPILNQVDFYGNTASQYGGGMYNSGGSITLTNVTFSGNSASQTGGGMYNSGGSITLTNVTFSGNSANQGGGIFNNGSSPTLINVTFSENTATNHGGGMYNEASSPTLTNVTFYGNSAFIGSAIYDINNSDPVVTNTIVWGHTGEQIYGDFGSFPVITYSVIQNGWLGDGNISSDPVLLPLTDNGGYTHTHALGAGSSAIDTGNPDVCPHTDQRIYARPTDGDGIDGPRCDIGAYEFASFPAVFTLTADILGSGSVVKVPDKAAYNYGEIVELYASADTDWEFIGWSGDINSTDNPITITILENTNITANFRFDAWTLIVSVNPLDSGQVAVYPDYLTYHYGDLVTITALPNPGWSFTNWTGDASGTNSQIVVTMTDNLSITASFSKDEYLLTVSSNPTEMGSVDITPSQPFYYYGDEVTLTATPAFPGWRFIGWSGDASGDTNPLPVTITGNTEITANFSDQYTLTTIVDPMDSGTVLRDINQETYTYGTQVVLTANPNHSWVFASWGGDARGLDNPLTITIQGNTNITALFDTNWIFLPLLNR